MEGKIIRNRHFQVNAACKDAHLSVSMLWLSLVLLLPARGFGAFFPLSRLPGAKFINSIDFGVSIAPSPFAISQTFASETFRARNKHSTPSVVLQLASHTASDLAIRLGDYARSANDNAVMISFSQSALSKADLSVRLVAFGTSSALKQWMHTTLRDGDRIISSDDDDLLEAFV